MKMLRSRSPQTADRQSRRTVPGTCASASPCPAASCAATRAQRGVRIGHWTKDNVRMTACIRSNPQIDVSCAQRYQLECHRKVGRATKAASNGSLLLEGVLQNQHPAAQRNRHSRHLIAHAHTPRPAASAGAQGPSCTELHVRAERRHFSRLTPFQIWSEDQAFSLPHGCDGMSIPGRKLDEGSMCSTVNAPYVHASQ